MDSLWTRRSNTSKLSLSMSNDASTSQKVFGGPQSISNKSRGGDSSSHSRHFNPFNNVSPLVTSLPSPSTSASSAFGLGSGAFATFSSNLKTPTSTRPQADGANNSSTAVKTPQSAFPIGTTPTTNPTSTTKRIPERVRHPLKYTWVVWYRSPGSKFQDYEKSTTKIAAFSTGEEFWTLYTHLRRPSILPHVSDYHFFKEGIRPVWEDEENRNGGKWIIRLKKGVSTRYWEDLLLAMVGDQFSDVDEDLCGVVLSIRSNEDVLSVWTKVDGASCLKIKQTMCRMLGFPVETQVVFKTHASSIEAVNNKNPTANANPAV
ncbi:translation initiation factor eIF 4e-like domain-containing protein [Terfezia claveryi]|nr:translation initiation factor eIF 4e-like domain-containing protein [Terfezia claveryi]